MKSELTALTFSLLVTVNATAGSWLDESILSGLRGDELKNYHNTAQFNATNQLKFNEDGYDSRAAVGNSVYKKTQDDAISKTITLVTGSKVTTSGVGIACIEIRCQQ